MRLDVVLRVATKFMLAPLLLFALYVQFHGDYGPGGGFQAGVIAAAAIILYGLINGLGPVQRIVPVGLLEVLIPGGVLIYVAVGLASMLLGDNFLDYNHLAHDRIHGQEWGVFLVEVGVFLTVFSTMIAIYYAFAGRRRS
ncbi:Na(+)/H(+) antiporter subunit B [Kaistia defluvii]|uniref:Na(+)/H(+) antiporter subunit B n=1 Tax=Kaistia defluvii TaxID=410841 RepID=UPI002256EFF9|nr:Na(+)/H(+) antiporter subunit B [Kaistia defluvii]MCX5520138.1 Na(+)/H(+) antiporter subunit B [Kaistia defluvii]